MNPQHLQNQSPSMEGYVPLIPSHQCMCQGVFRQCNFCGSFHVNVIDIIIHGQHFTFCKLECLNRMIYCNRNGVLQVVQYPPFTKGRTIYQPQRPRRYKKPYHRNAQRIPQKQAQPVQPMQPEEPFFDTTIAWADQVELEK